MDQDAQVHHVASNDAVSFSPKPQGNPTMARLLCDGWTLTKQCFFGECGEVETVFRAVLTTWQTAYLLECPRRTKLLRTRGMPPCSSLVG
jgi:hypothetical protein